jgi:flagellar basal-body rod modification protein FlgD
MAVSGITSATANSAASALGGSSTQLNSDAFLKLLVAQLKNQDPLDPVKDTDFLAQLAQFSTLEGVTQLNSNFSSMLRVQQLTQGAGLVGRDVVYQQPGSTGPTHGTVQAINLQNGSLEFLINGTTVTFDQIQGIVSASGQ